MDYNLPGVLLCPWDSAGKTTGVDCHSLLQGIIPTQGWNPHLKVPALAGGFFTTSATYIQIHEFAMDKKP